MSRRSSRSSRPDASLVQRRQPGGVEGPPPAEPGQLVEERPPGRDEQPDRLGQARPGGRQPPSEVVDERRRLRLRAGSLGGVGGIGVEVSDEGRRRAVGRHVDSARARRVVVGAGRWRATVSDRVASPVGAGEALRARAEARQRAAAGAPASRRAPRSCAGRTVGGRPASRRPRSGRRPPSGGACPGRPRRDGWQGPSDSHREVAVGASDTQGLVGSRVPTGRSSVGGYARSDPSTWAIQSGWNLGESRYRGYAQAGGG